MSVEKRSRIYAALGEPVRLEIVDLLIASDHTPGELGQRLGVPSNLMAHHLRTLEAAGIVRRVKSEGDKRRSYLQLCREDPFIQAMVTAGVAGTGAGVLPVARVIFVCTHNSARSQLAAAAWQSLSAVPATSAGTHPADRVHPRTLTVGRRHGLRLGRARTCALTTVLQAGDLIVTVCDNAHEELKPTASPILHWSVPDPVPTNTDEAFESALTQITSRIGDLAEALHPGPSAPVRSNADAGAATKERKL